jgi:hypothetical protein
MDGMDFLDLFFSGARSPRRDLGFFEKRGILGNASAKAIDIFCF